MKKHTQLFSLSVTTLISLLLAGSAGAQTAADDASVYTNGWGTGTNLGTGFLPWVLTNNNGAGGGFAGNFVGNSGTVIDTSFKSFGLYANGGSASNFSIAYRSISNNLAPGSVFKVKLANTSIATGGYMGVALRSTTNLSTSTNEAFITEADTAFAFYFNGGANDYLIWDGTGVQDSGIGFTTGGLSLELAPLSGNSYRLVVKSADGNTTLQSYSPALLAGNAGGGTPITTFAGFNFHTGGSQNFYFNSLNVSSTSLVPPTIVNVFPTNGAIYIDPTTNTVSFEVDSLFSTVATNAITMSLNGTNITNLFFGGTPTNVLVTMASNILAANQVYTNVIVATDGNGNKATNISTFNTWSVNLLFIEAEDYNHDGGNFISGGTPPGNITPNQYGIQSGTPLAGTNGIDYFKPGPNDGGTNAYRPGDLGYVDLDGPPISADVDHNGFTNNGYVDYNLSFVEAGEWENYTRTFASNSAYAVYARMASLSANPVMEIDRDAAPTATTTNQPLMPLGTAVCPAFTGGSQTYAFVPLTDFFSQPVLLRLNGNNTLRSMRIGGGYNFNYLVLVPGNTTNTLRPYISAGFPFPTATGVAVDTKISFNIAHRQTSVTNSNIHLSLNSVDVTSGLVISNNAAGALVTYQPPGLLPSNTTNTLQAVMTDSGGVTLTNTWTFTTENPTIVPTSYAQVNPGTSRGFSIQIAKAVDNAPATLFVDTVARAEAQLLGPLTDTNNQTYVNIALNGGIAVETNVINYDIDALTNGIFPNTTAFPDIPAAATNNYIAMAATMYVPLTNGIYTFAVDSDDGFKFTTGPTPANTNTTLGLFDNNRAPAESTFDFIIQTNGYYPMRLLYFQGLAGGEVELYSVNRTNGTRILLNDPTNANAFVVYQAVTSTRPTITIARSGANVVLNWSGNHTLQSSAVVNGTNSGFTDVPGPVTNAPYTNTPSGKAMYYRLRN
jgi:hypothetical protein